MIRLYRQMIRQELAENFQKEYIINYGNRKNCNTNREATKISAIEPRKINTHEYLTYEKIIGRLEKHLENQTNTTKEHGDKQSNATANQKTQHNLIKSDEDNLIFKQKYCLMNSLKKDNNKIILELKNQLIMLKYSDNKVF